jgi:hypothetical protein
MPVVEPPRARTTDEAIAEIGRSAYLAYIGAFYSTGTQFYEACPLRVQEHAMQLNLSTSLWCQKATVVKTRRLCVVIQSPSTWRNSTMSTASTKNPTRPPNMISTVLPDGLLVAR